MSFVSPSAEISGVFAEPKLMYHHPKPHTHPLLPQALSPALTDNPAVKLARLRGRSHTPVKHTPPPPAQSVSAMNLRKLMQFTTFSGGRPRAPMLALPPPPSAAAGSWRERRAVGMGARPRHMPLSGVVQQTDRLLGLRLLHVGPAPAANVKH
jgi:hypothetical protein